MPFPFRKRIRMIKPDQIPNDALNAAVNAANESDPFYVNRIQISDAIVAAINGWAGSEVLWFGKGPSLILPLTQEDVDDEA